MARKPMYPHYPQTDPELLHERGYPVGSGRGRRMSGAGGGSTMTHLRPQDFGEDWPQRDDDTGGAAAAQRAGQAPTAAHDSGRFGYGGVIDESDRRRYQAARRAAAAPAAMSRRVQRGPKGYTRSDERIRDDICERLHYADDVDVGDVSVDVSAGTVKLEGTVPQRWMKYRIEDLCDDALGVLDIDNRIRVGRGGEAPAQDLQSL
ncbi:MAG: BON domain-containing protein, partial [Gammaproteobacteria bacterium]